MPCAAAASRATARSTRVRDPAHTRPPGPTFFCILRSVLSTSQYSPAARSSRRTSLAYAREFSEMGTTMTCGTGDHVRRKRPYRYLVPVHQPHTALVNMADSSHLAAQDISCTRLRFRRLRFPSASLVRPRGAADCSSTQHDTALSPQLDPTRRPPVAG